MATVAHRTHICRKETLDLKTQESVFLDGCLATIKTFLPVCPWVGEGLVRQSQPVVWCVPPLPSPVKEPQHVGCSQHGHRETPKVESSTSN